MRASSPGMIELAHMAGSYRASMQTSKDASAHATQRKHRDEQ